MKAALLLGNRTLQMAFFFTAICVFSTLSPSMPTQGLDPSWQFAMNEVVRTGLAFGREISFSFGPYSAVYTREYHPATDRFVLAASILLGIAYWFAATRFFRAMQWPVLAALVVLLPNVVLFRDALLFSYTLLVAIWTFNVLQEDRRSDGVKKSRLFECYLIFSPLGLLPLIKGSLLMPSAGIALLSFVWLGRSGRINLALSGSLAIATSSVLFWLFSGQSPSDLPRYFVAMLPIVSGYTDAMSIDGWIGQIKRFLIASAILLTWISTRASAAINNRIFLALCVGLYLFIAFKAGFVRHDVHAIIAGTSILIGAIVLGLAMTDRLHGIVLMAALVTWYSCDELYARTAKSLLSNVSISAKSTLSAIVSRLADKNSLETRYEEALREIRGVQPLPILSGTSDIYSFNQSFLIASGNVWNPRPTLQSYSVYTPALVRRNVEHLTSKNRPDNIFFRIETIDKRFPALDDGASWPALLGLYQPNGMTGDYLLLRKREGSSRPVDLRHLSANSHHFSRPVRVPDDGRTLFVKISIDRTFLGRAASLLYKPSQLEIEVRFADKGTERYRLIADMARTGFLLSPIIRTTTDFQGLFSKDDYPDDRRVESFMIRPVTSPQFWKSEYSVEFISLD